MAPLLLHAVSPSAEPAAGSAGLRGARLIRLDVDGLAVWATELSGEPPTFTRADLLDHHRVVAELFAGLDACLPARFPTLLPDADALRQVVAARHADLTRQLQQLAGCCELAVTVVWSTPDEAEPAAPDRASGREYLLRRQRALAGADRRRARAQALADAIERQVGPDLAAAQRQVCPSPRVALSLALLVRRERAPAVQASLGRALPDVRILVNGPWPPYSFAGVRSE